MGGQVRAAGGEKRESRSDSYAVLRNSWLIRRATARSQIITYFPDLYACWYSYERALSDYISLVNPEDREGRVDDLEKYVDRDFAYSYVDPENSDGCGALGVLPPVVQARHAKLKNVARWSALKSSSNDKSFKAAYQVLGEDLIIGMERIINTISNKPADGFSHGVHLFGVDLRLTRARKRSSLCDAG